MSKWIEVSLTVDGEAAEAVAEILARYAHQGVAIEQPLKEEIWPDEPVGEGPLIVKAYLLASTTSDETIQKIREGLYFAGRLYPIPEPVISTVDEEDWANAWKQHYHPIRVGKRLLIRPPWADVELNEGDIEIIMDPGQAFGTGTHPTTQLCLQACEWFCRPATSMLDLGAGSGILSIAAAKLGCFRVIARDIDEAAVVAAQENVERNQVDDAVIVQHGSLAGLVTSSRHFDLAMANITANVITDLAGQGLQHVVWPGGKFIFSGIIDEQAEDLITKLDSIGLKLLDTRTLGDWVMLITRRAIP
ncbi:MAG: 50S ribosomal protein L11 methyltransferase [Chloroflexi bacterium]|nr:50S ribosomal protein L11 methyltransferase [Chloroflexota bacterium]